jgi:hypothetical protein
MGIDTDPGTTTGFQPVTAQNIGGTSAYQVTMTNNTSSPVTVDGFAVSFSAYGSQVTADNPTVNTSLVETGESWNFIIDMTSGGIQVSDNTYLNMTCTVNQVETAKGPVTPNQITEPNGEQNTHVADVQQARQQLSSNIGTLQKDSASLDSDMSLAQAVSQMKSDYQAEENDWQTEQQDAGTCGVSGDASAVGGYASAVGGALNSLQSAVSYLQENGVQAVRNDLAAVNGDVGTLHGLDATPAVSYSGAVAAGNKALSDAASAISWADGQGNTINGEAQSLATTAQNYANAHSC